MTERKPPHNLDAERAVLGAVLIQPTAWLVIADLDPEDFYLPAHREIHRAMAALDRAKKSIDHLTLGDQLRKDRAMPALEGGDGYLLRLADSVATAENVGHYVQIVRAASIKRRLIGNAMELVQRCYDERYDADDLLAQVAALAPELAGRERSKLMRVGECAAALMAEIERRSQAGPAGAMSPVRSGIRALDELTNGHVGPDLVVVGGPPGQGKSALIAGYGEELSMRQGGVFYCANVEMLKQQIVERLVVRRARVDSRYVKRGELTKDDWRQLYRAFREWEAPTFYIDDDVSSVEEFEHRARLVRAKHPNAPMAVAFDFLQMARSAHGDAEDDRIGSNSYAMKGVAKRLEVPVLLASAFNRGDESTKAAAKKGKPKPPTNHSLRGSGMIESAADTILLLWNNDGDDEILVSKNRNGPTGKVRVKWTKKWFLHEDPDEVSDVP